MTFTLKQPIGTNYRADPDDIMSTKRALAQLGYYKVPPHRGIDDWTDDAMFDGIRSFQKSNGLKVDAFMRPDGPTAKAINNHVQLVANDQADQQQETGMIGTIKQGIGAIKQGIDNIGQRAGAAGDMLGNYQDMRDANVKNSDKYFHCKGNFEAAQRGPKGAAMAGGISDLREWLDQNIKGSPASDSEEDQKANKTGRAAGRKGGLSAAEACGSYRPNGLPSRY